MEHIEDAENAVKEKKKKPVTPIHSKEALFISGEAKEVLVAIWKSDISLLELKLLHMYLAKLESDAAENISGYDKEKGIT